MTWVWGQPKLHSKYQASQNFIKHPHFHPHSQDFRYMHICVCCCFIYVIYKFLKFRILMGKHRLNTQLIEFSQSKHTPMYLSLRSRNKISWNKTPWHPSALYISPWLCTHKVKHYYGFFHCLLLLYFQILSKWNYGIYIYFSIQSFLCLITFIRFI